MNIANIMLNEEPNSNDAMHVMNNVYLTTMGTQQLLMATIQLSCKNANLPERRNNDTITRKDCVDGNTLCPGKE